jgi:DNA topoisomerase-3
MAPTKKKSKATGTTKRKAPASFKAKVKPDAVLAAVVGSAADSRPQMVKKIWDYIKKHHLQDKVDGRRINADATTRPLFGKAQISMLEIGGIISKHVKAV